jgi:hypothetical protein
LTGDPVLAILKLKGESCISFASGKADTSLDIYYNYFVMLFILQINDCQFDQ